MVCPLGCGEGTAHADEIVTTQLPPAVQASDVEEHLGAFVPKDIVLRSERGEPVKTGDLLGSPVPTVLVLAYYRCPMLCPLLVDSAAKGLAASGYVAGRDYRLVTVSIDPTDRPDDAMKRRDHLLGKIGQEASPGVFFTVGDPDATKAVADAVGFRYAFDPKTDQYAHPAVVTVLAPGGRISRYLYGIEPPVKDLRLAIVEASQGKVGTLVDRVLVNCYRYDPALHRYGPFIQGFFRLGSLAILGVVGAGLGFYWRNERKRARQ